MSRVTDGLTVRDEDPDSFDDFGAKGVKTWKVIERLDNRYTRE